MREVVLYMSMSLDGYVASDRKHPGVAIEDPEVKQWKLDRIRDAGAHLMGRITYEEMASYWPTSEDAYAAPMNERPKVVFSSSLTDAEATWPETRVAPGSRTRSPPSRLSPGTTPSSGAAHGSPVRSREPT